MSHVLELKQRKRDGLTEDLAEDRKMSQGGTGMTQSKP
jgi:hypothetical protein